MPRIRELGIDAHIQRWWRLPPGPLNAITDVDGVAVGHYTLIAGEGPLRPGHGPFRTGVTVVLPHTGNLYAEKVPAAVHTINGYGKVAGFEQVRETGLIETPIALTGTLNVPRVADALITLAIEQNPHIGIGLPEKGRKGYTTVNPVVGETNDGYLSDVHARPIGEKEVRAAIAAATTGPVEEGAVGAGTGTSCFGWKGGIGTASRVIPQEFGGYTLGALVQTNFGRPEELIFLGLPVGAWLTPPSSSPEPQEEGPGGSIMIVVATDAPLTPRQLGRVARRAAFGLARTGSTCRATSGDFVIAFSTAYREREFPPALVEQRPTLVEDAHLLNALFLAVIEAVEEAILNSLTCARTVVGRDGNTRHRLPWEDIVPMLNASFTPG